MTRHGTVDSIPAVEGRRRSPAKQSKSKERSVEDGRGGCRAGSGAPSGNKNAQKFMPIKMPKTLDVFKQEDFKRFVKHIMERLAEGKSDGRIYGTLSTWAYIFMEISGWRQKAPINIIQAQSTMTLDQQAFRRQLSALVKKLPTKLQLELWECVKEDRVEPVPDSSSAE
jgi:hypothetical protein